MDTKTLIKYATRVSYVLGGFLALLLVLSLVILELNKNPDAVARKRKADEIFGPKVVNQNLPKPWPPEMNQPYPELSLIDSKGAPFKLSDKKGKVMVVEYIDMSSPLSQSYSGAKEKGVYGGATKTFDEGVSRFEEIASKENQGQAVLPSPDIIFIKVIIYNENGEQAKSSDAELWEKHFGFTSDNNYFVTVPEKDIRDKLTDRIVPGFHLIDKEFNLRVDSAGSEPKHSLQFRLVTMIPTLLAAEVEE
ncbi:MAG: hypothetical protein WBC26_07785 [Alphaproteobacteria bacterium]|nr:hypothetical protein [Alphaproteobacteria bacterium]MBP7761816.1 hypothetical protein [Alphaproteobacteria bacterium]